MSPEAARIEQLQQELVALRRELDDVAHSIGHDLRAPLRHITAYAALLREELGDTLNADAAGYLGTINSSAQRMGRMVDGLMELSHLGRVTLHLAVVDVRAVINEVCAGLAPQLHGRQVVWQVPDTLPAARADVQLLRELWRQVLGNALKFTARREAAEVRISAAVLADGHVQWQVQDNGCGFNPQRAGQLGQVFVRLHSTTDYDGLGLGLALVRRIAQRHGGSMAVSSDGVDAGCRVSWTLPQP